jgi:hypothetical protein
MYAPYMYRWNPDLTIDAICTVCYETVCRERTLTLVREAETKHQCPGTAKDLTVFERSTVAPLPDNAAKS